jgi:hypothetical protein
MAIEINRARSSVADPVFHFDVDPDPGFHFDEDPDPTSQNDADSSSMRIRIRNTGMIPTIMVPISL